MLYGYLFDKRSRVIVSDIKDVVLLQGNEIVGRFGSISGLPTPDDTLTGFIITSQQFNLEDVLPVDVPDQISEVYVSNGYDDRVQQLEADLKKAKADLITAQRDNASTMSAVTALFELLLPAPAPPAESEESSEA